MTRRSGRRPGNSGTRGAILDAARAEFAGKGYDRTTIRSIAARAGVDGALVHHFFGTKPELFEAALEFPLDPAALFEELLATDRDNLGVGLVRTFLDIWDTAEDRSTLLALLRSMAQEDAVVMVRRMVHDVVLGPLAAAVGRPDAPLRANLAGTQIVGLAMARYVIRIEPLASTPAEQVAAAVGPTIQRYLTGDLGAVTPR